MAYGQNVPSCDPLAKYNNVDLNVRFCSGVARPDWVCLVTTYPWTSYLTTYLVNHEKNHV